MASIIAKLVDTYFAQGIDHNLMIGRINGMGVHGGHFIGNRWDSFHDRIDGVWSEE